MILGARGWSEPPTNKILSYKPTPRSNFCLLAPAQFFTLQGISDGVTKGGIPGGRHFGSPPSLVPSPGEMRSPRQISGWWLVWVRRQAAGHTHFHLYIVDLLEILTIFFDKDSKAEKKSFNLNRLGLSKIPKRTNKGIIGGSSIVI